MFNNDCVVLIDYSLTRIFYNGECLKIAKVDSLLRLKTAEASNLWKTNAPCPSIVSPHVVLVSNVIVFSFCFIVAAESPAEIERTKNGRRHGRW